MQWVQNGPHVGDRGYDECSEYRMGLAWVTEDMINSVGREWVTPGLLRRCQRRSVHNMIHICFYVLYISHIHIFDSPCQGMRIIYTTSKVKHH